MIERRPASLRRVFSITAVMIALLAVVAAGSLVIVTSMLHKITDQTASAVESIHVVEEAEITLLLHARAKDRIVERQLEGELRGYLERARRYVTSAEEARILGDAELRVDSYLQVARDPAIALEDRASHEARAYEALERLVNLTFAQTRAAQEQATAWNRIANIAGISLGASIVVLAIVGVLWLRRWAIRPLLALARTMKRFSTGQRSVRAEELGPEELRDMSRRFNEMAEAIAAQRQAQTAFLGGVAHDLRNPLSALKLALDLLGPDQPLPEEPQLRRTLGIISRQIDHLDRMVGDFLALSRIESGALDLRRAEHDLRATVREAAELFDPLSRHRFHLTLPDSSVLLSCDAGRIAQAVTNLVSNAIKYSPADEPIDITLAVTENDVTIEVTDRGVGIPRDDLERIFEPFRRGASRSTVEGTGLGLFNVKRIVEAHDGRIEVESTPGVGSTFKIRLPRTPATERT